MTEEILNSPNADQAKEIASRVPSHLRGTWHKEKCDIMEEILELTPVQNFNKLINCLGKRLVEAIKSDILWSSGLNPSDSSTTKAYFYPGQNRLGHVVERVRANLLLRNTKKKQQVIISMTLMMRHHRLRTLQQPIYHTSTVYFLDSPPNQTSIQIHYLC